MIGGDIGRSIGCPGREEAALGEGTGTISTSFAVSGIGAARFRALGEIAPLFAVSGVGDSIISEARMITDTVTYLQKPVDYALANDQDEKKRRMRTRGVMTRTTMKKIFGE